MCFGVRVGRGAFLLHSKALRNAQVVEGGRSQSVGILG